MLGAGRYFLPLGDGETRQEVGLNDARRKGLGLVRVSNWVFKEDFDQFVGTFWARDKEEREREQRKRALEGAAE